METHFFALLLLGIPAFAQQQANQPPASGKQIQVSLFGQPCMLSGPVDEAMLNNIHSVSPEQMPAAENGTQAKQSMEKVRKPLPLPSALDRYRDRLAKHYEAQLAFHDGLEAAKRSAKVEPLLKATKNYVTGKRAKEFETLTRRISSKQKPAAWDQTTLEQVQEAYAGASEAYPEEEFHRAIQRIGVRYTCSFDESEGD